jgi:hypothetical protein
MQARIIQQQQSHISTQHSNTNTTIQHFTNDIIDCKQPTTPTTHYFEEMNAMIQLSSILQQNEYTEVHPQH